MRKDSFLHSMFLKLTFFFFFFLFFFLQAFLYKYCIPVRHDLCGGGETSSSHQWCEAILLGSKQTRGGRF